MKIDVLANRDVVALLLLVGGSVAACTPEGMRFFRPLQFVAGLSIISGLFIVGSGLWSIVVR